MNVRVWDNSTQRQITEYRSTHAIPNIGEIMWIENLSSFKAYKVVRREWRIDNSLVKEIVQEVNLFVEELPDK